jgi:hypothetical protein
MVRLCKFNISVQPHSSNKTGHEDGTNIISGRPDYRIDVYSAPHYARKYTNSFGEVKPVRCSEIDILKDFYKLALYGKLGLKHSPTIQRILLFRTIGTNIIFYLMHRFSPNIYFMTHITKFIIPTTAAQFSIMAGQLYKLYKIVYLYKKYCFEDEEVGNSIPHTNNLPYSVVQDLLKASTNNKRKCEWASTSSCEK